jgi:hypothetical protein
VMRGGSGDGGVFEELIGILNEYRFDYERD